jgi:methyl-accepting chemotaxis protein/ligand-binding sensor domain-containing protein
MNYLVVLTCCLLLLAAIAPAQRLETTKTDHKGLDPSKRLTQYLLDVWQEDNGLPQNSVQSITQTPDGYLWFATQEGVVRFDGLHCKVFDKKNIPELKDNYIITLTFDAQGRLWLCSRSGGVLMYEQGTFTRKSPETFSIGEITDMAFDRQGVLWVTMSTGLYHLVNGQFVPVSGSNAPKNVGMARLFHAASGDVLIASDRGMYRYAQGVFTLTTKADGLAATVVSAVYQRKDGSVLVATDSGFTSIKNGIYTTYTKQQGLSTNSINTFFEDRHGTVFIGTKDGGVNRLNAQGEIDTLTVNNGLKANQITCFWADREGSLWFGTEAGGLHRLKLGKFSNIGVSEGLTDNLVWSVYQDRTGAMWLGTARGLNKVVGGKVVQTFTTQNGFPGNIMGGLYHDKDNTLWAGIRGVGTMTINLNTGAQQLLTQRDGLANVAAGALHQDREGNLWIGGSSSGNDGLTLIRNGVKTNFTTKDGLSNNSVTFIEELRSGEILFATKNGLTRYANGTFTPINDLGGIAFGRIQYIHEDNDGTVWLATRSKGLFRMKNNQLFVFTAEQGLPDDLAHAILEDNKGYLWMSCNKGIMKIAKQELNAVADGKQQRVSALLYGKGDGMRSAECNGGYTFSALETADGKFWFATVAGAAIVDPNNAERNDYAPPVYVEHCIADKQQYEARAGLELPAGTANITIYFSALSMLFPSKVRCKYKLEGFDDDWIDAGSQRSASYTRIPPGTYTLRVIACNNDGVWNEQGAAFAFSVKPYFYQTWWFYLLCAVVVVAAVYQAYRMRVRSTEQRAKHLDALVQEMTSDLQRAHETALAEKASVEQKVEQAVRQSEAEKHYLASSVETLLVEMNKFASGVLTVRLAPQHNDDIGRLYEGFTKAAQNLRTMVVNVTEAIRRTSAETQEIASSAENMAHDTETQVSQVHHIRTAVEEMNSTINSTTQNIQELATIAEQSGNSAKHGGDIVSATIAGMSRIDKVVQSSADTVQELGKSSEEIGAIVEVINSIAEQTNLLALNAAIEAARAGDHGRGFAVVADEIRKLSESTTQATKQIASMVKQIQLNIAATVDSMRRGTQETEQGRLLAEQAGAALATIIHNTAKVAEITTQVAAASEEQAHASKEIQDNVEEMATLIERLTKETGDISGAVENLKHLMGEVASLSQQFTTK